MFSCGMGAVRTTFAMVAALVVRRRQLEVLGIGNGTVSFCSSFRLPRPPPLPDPDGVIITDLPLITRRPLPLAHLSYVLLRLILYYNDINVMSSANTHAHRFEDNAVPRASKRAAGSKQDIITVNLDIAAECVPTNFYASYHFTNSCIHPTALQTKNSQGAVELLLTSPTLLDNLRKAYLGNYSVILSLLGCLDHGLEAKRLVDKVIDSCACTIMHYFIILNLFHFISILIGSCR